MTATDRRIESYEQTVAEIRRYLKEILAMMQSWQQDLQNLRGQFAESATRKKAPSITMAVGISIGKRLINKRILTQSDLSNFTKNADASRIPYNHIISFQEADLIIEAYNL